MKRIQIQNEFTQWAEYLARYFGHDLLIYDTNGNLMWGSPAVCHREPSQLSKDFNILIVYADIAQPIAYLDISHLTGSEVNILECIIPFIESQLDDAE